MVEEKRREREGLDIQTFAQSVGAAKGLVRTSCVDFGGRRRQETRGDWWAGLFAKWPQGEMRLFGEKISHNGYCDGRLSFLCWDLFKILEIENTASRF